MSGSDMKGTWAREGYTFQFTRDTEWEGNPVPTIQYRSPFTKKSDHYQFEQVLFVIIPQRLKWKLYSLHWVLRPASVKGVEVVKPNVGC